MAPSRVTDADVLTTWRRMEARRLRVRVATTKFRVGQHVRIRKEKIIFVKAAEHNFSTEIIKIVNPSTWVHLNPSSYCVVGRLFYGVFKLWSKLQRK